jgi:hypothetical protein
LVFALAPVAANTWLSVRGAAPRKCRLFSAHGFGTGVAVAPRMKKLIADQRGQIFLEYLVLFVIVGAGLVLMVGPVIGPKMVHEYAKRRTLLYATYP